MSSSFTNTTHSGEGKGIVRKAHQPGVVNEASSLLGRHESDAPPTRHTAAVDNERQLKLALLATDALTLIVNAKGGTCDFVSKQWLEFTGQLQETLLTPLGWVEAVHPEDRDRAVLFSRTAIENGVESRESCRVFRRRDRAYRWFELRVMPVCPRTGVGALSFNDVHEAHALKAELAELEDKMRRAEKMQTLGQLAGGVAHDFNNLLTIIVACTDEALEMTTSPEVSGTAELREPLHEIRVAVKRATSLTRDLLGYSRHEPNHRRTVALADVVNDAERMLARIVGEDIELRVEHGGRDLVKIDPAQWTSVVMNLAVNARHAMPRGGALSISTTSASLTEGEATDIPAGTYAVLEIHDTGVGIGPDVAKKIFEPFFTTKSAGKGTGLGLAVVKNIVDESDGFIRVASEVGRGTTFRIYLPIAHPTVPPFSSTIPRANGANGTNGTLTDVGTETVLLVEDDPAVRRAAMRSLEARGFKLLVANDAEEALSILEEKQGAIDLVITDVVLPKMNGKRLIDEVATRYPKIRSLFTSGYATEDVVRYGLLTTDENVAFLQKPYTPRRLVRKMREVLDRS